MDFYSTHKYDTLADIKLLQSIYTDLKVKIEWKELTSGIKELFYKLYGTVPVYYYGRTYNTPICIWIPPNKQSWDGLEVYVVPSFWMYVRKNEFVDEKGRVRLHKLANWQTFKSLRAQLYELVNIFSQYPPLGSLTQLNKLDDRTEYIAKLQLDSFEDPVRTKQDAIAVSEIYMDMYGAFQEKFVDGTRKYVLNLNGKILGEQFPIPFYIQLTDKYPRQPPKVYVVTASVMKLNKSCTNVDSTGLVKTPYLVNWSAHSSDLIGLMEDLYVNLRRTSPVLMNSDNLQRQLLATSNGMFYSASREKLCKNGYVPGRKPHYEDHSDEVPGRRA